jgi:hypothetical protein
MDVVEKHTIPAHTERRIAHALIERRRLSDERGRPSLEYIRIWRNDDGSTEYTIRSYVQRHDGRQLHISILLETSGGEIRFVH